MFVFDACMSADKWTKKTASNSRRRNKNSNSLWKRNTIWNVEKNENTSVRCCDVLDVFTIYQIQCNHTLLLRLHTTLWLCVGSSEAITFAIRTHTGTHKAAQNTTESQLRAYSFSTSLSLQLCVSVHGIEYNWITKNGSGRRSSSGNNIPKRQQLSKTTN